VRHAQVSFRVAGERAQAVGPFRQTPAAAAAGSARWPG
jgi:hypothetical protein